MVRTKMEQKEYIILCLEDSNDWSNATTRRLVMQVRRAAAAGVLGQGGSSGVGLRLGGAVCPAAGLGSIPSPLPCFPALCPPPAQVDPSLTRTVVVSTKLDTRIPQFARPHDVEMYLRPPSRLLEPTMLGGSPFFT